MDRGNGIHRKAFVSVALSALLTVFTVSPATADEADDIVEMMSWWDEYGRYWDETGADTSGNLVLTLAEIESVADVAHNSDARVAGLHEEWTLALESRLLEQVE